jgi:hypothetical protein
MRKNRSDKSKENKKRINGKKKKNIIILDNKRINKYNMILNLEKSSSNRSKKNHNREICKGLDLLTRLSVIRTKAKQILKMSLCNQDQY